MILKDVDLAVFLNKINESMQVYQKHLGKQHLGFNLSVPTDYEKLVIYTDELKLKHIIENILKMPLNFQTMVP